jgi:formylglycine-generating enzyme required for sulfatase activity
VGKKKANAWGLFEMHGNVFEWCSDWLGNYGQGAVTDPQGPSEGSHRVYRGGCFASRADLCDSAERYAGHPEYSDDTLGFRLALSHSGAAPPEAAAAK